MLSVNKTALKICEEMIERAEELGVKHSRFKNGAHVLDTGHKTEGGIQAGLCVTRICLGGLGETSFTSMKLNGINLPAVEVSTDFPIFSFLCQGSGGLWGGEGWVNFRFGSYGGFAGGPARGLVHEPEELFRKIGYKDYADVAVVVLQSEQYPDEKVAEHLAKRCRVDLENLYLVLTPLTSMAGIVQVTGRSVENGMVKLSTLNYNVRNVRHAYGIAPLPPLNSSKIIPDDMLSYASIVHLYIMPDEKENLQEIAKNMPSRTSKDYGKPFVRLVKEHGGWKGIDIDLFAPAKVYINDLRTGEIYESGELNADLIKTIMGHR